MSETIQTKYCSKCKKTLPLSEFHKTRRNKDGLQIWCKSCQKAYLKDYQQTEKGKAVRSKGVAKYRQTPKGKAGHRKDSAKYQKTPNGRAVQRKSNAKSKARNPNRIKAESAVHSAIRAGRLPRPDTLLCHYCSKPAQEYHHWKGYEPEHWLDVVPVCIECHTKEHRKIA